MITIYRRAQVIARCERAEVLAGLKSGRFEPTDHYESPETDGWVSLTHFESRAFERSSLGDSTNGRVIYSYGDTVEPNPTHRPLTDQDKLQEMLRHMEAARPKPYPEPKPTRAVDPGPNPIVELLGLLATPFVMMHDFVDFLVELLGGIIAQIALYVIPVVIIVITVILSLYAPRVIPICVALFLLLRKKE